MHATSLQGFGYGDVVHQFEKRCNIHFFDFDWRCNYYYYIYYDQFRIAIKY
ncbi:MAG: hypothetical protein O4965_32305 [Trichodesmium sp. St19_bin1]|nr:hypothetical protein [Trichodesmium sp. St19_bin1]